MNIILTALTILVILVCYVVGVGVFLEFEKRQVARQKEFETWLFESLYSINHKVLLPTEHEKPTVAKKATVYIPGKDPYAEFTGKQDDFFGDD